MEYALIGRANLAELIPKTFAEIGDHEELRIAGVCDAADYRDVSAERGTYYIATSGGLYFAGYIHTKASRFKTKREAVTVCMRPGDVQSLTVGGPIQAPNGFAFVVHTNSPDVPFGMWFSNDTLLDPVGGAYGSEAQARVVADVLLGNQ